jgi:hypothetical protein
MACAERGVERGACRLLGLLLSPLPLRVPRAWEVSSVHAPLFIQADIAPEGWLHEWYVIAMVCEKLDARGRRFVAGTRDADAESEVDISSTTKVQVVCIKEAALKPDPGLTPTLSPSCQETLQQIVNGEEEMPARWQDDRHYNRWSTMALIAQCYRQHYEDPNSPQGKHLLRLCIPARRADHMGRLHVNTQQKRTLPRRGSVPSFGVFDTTPTRGEHALLRSHRHPARGQSWERIHQLAGEPLTPPMEDRPYPSPSLCSLSPSPFPPPRDIAMQAAGAPEWQSEWDEDSPGLAPQQPAPPGSQA